MTLSAEEIKSVLLQTIPQNLILAEHTEFGHFYRHVPTNQLFASVTTKSGILEGGDHLKKWAAKLGVEYFIGKVQIDRTLLDVSRKDDLEQVKAASILVHQDQFEDAGDIGTRGHNVVDSYLKEWMKTGVRPSDIRTFILEQDTHDSRVYAIARSAEMFCKEWDVTPIASELLVASLRYKFAGTLDSLMMVRRTTSRGNGACKNQASMFGNGPKEHFWMNASSRNPFKFVCNDCGEKSELEFALVDWKTSNSIDKLEYAMQTSAYWKAIFEMTGLKTKSIYIVRLDKSQAKYEVMRVVNPTAAFKAFTHVSKVYDWINDGSEKLAPANPKERISIDSLNFNIVN